MSQTVIFAPLLPLPLLWALAALSAALLALALWRGLSGWALRALASAFLLAALIGPSLQEEDRKPLSDIVLLVVDASASQSLSDRKAQTEAAVASVSAQVAALPDTVLRVVPFGDGADNAGSLAMTALADALAQEPRARVAGAIIVTDGQVHDAALAPAAPRCQSSFARRMSFVKSSPPSCEPGRSLLASQFARRTVDIHTGPTNRQSDITRWRCWMEHGDRRHERVYC